MADPISVGERHASTRRPREPRLYPRPARRARQRQAEPPLGQSPEARLPTAKLLAPWKRGWSMAFDQLMDAGATPDQAHDALGPQPLTDSGLSEEQCAEWAQWAADNPDKVLKLGEGR